MSEQMGFAQNVTFEYKKLVLLLVVISFTITFGALHHAAFDDDVLYMYKGGHVDVGRNCAMIFVSDCMIT